MFSRIMITDKVPSVKTSDTVRQVLDWMHHSGVVQLPIVNHEELLGLVSEADLLQLTDEQQPIGDIQLSIPYESFVYEDSHYYEVLKVMDKLMLDVVPVLDYQSKYLGMVTKSDIISYLSKLMMVNEPGGLIVLEVKMMDYSLSQIARICEDSNAKVLCLNLTNKQGTDKIYISLKLNISELSRLIASFERFNYSIASLVFDKEQLIDYKDNFDAFMKYLDI